LIIFVQIFIEQLTAAGLFSSMADWVPFIAPNIQEIGVDSADINPEIDTLAVPGGPPAARINHRITSQT
jgi:hypothetical protein